MAKSDKKLSALDRLCLEAMGEGKVFGNEADPARERWPNLWQWMSTCYVGKDRMKQPATLSVRLGPEGVLASLIDRDLSVSVEVSCSSLEMIFESLEASLTGPNPPVRNYGRKEPNLRRRRSL